MWLSLRMSEVRGLKYKDVRDGVLTVRRTILTVDGEHIIREQNKTYESTRRLTLSPYLEELIGTGAPDDFIVPMTGETIYKHFVRAIEAAGAAAYALSRPAPSVRLCARVARHSQPVQPRARRLVYR